MRIVYTKMVLVTLFWGASFVAGRFVAPYASPAELGFLRFAIATACMLVNLQSHGGLPRLGWRSFLSVSLLGATGIFAYNLLFFQGLQHVPASRAALIVTNNPVVIAIGAACFLGEKLSARRFAGIVLSVFGASIILSGGNPLLLFTQGLHWGDLLMVGCLLSWAAYSLLGKVVMTGLSPLAAVAWSSLVGTVMLFPFAVHDGLLQHSTTFSFSVWAGILFLAVFTTYLAYVWFYEGIKILGAARASSFVGLVPLFAVSIGMLLLGESLSFSTFVGGVLAIFGTWLANRG